MRKNKKRRRRDQFGLLRATIGQLNIEQAGQQIKQWRLVSAAKALDKVLADKKKREIARLQLKAEKRGLDKNEQKRARAFNIRSFKRPPSVKYVPVYRKGGKGASHYRRYVDGFIQQGRIKPIVVQGLITKEKKARAIYRMQQILQVTKKEALSITRAVERQVRSEYRKFKQTKKYRSLKPSEKKKVTFSRWRRWTLVGIEVLLGGEGSE